MVKIITNTEKKNKQKNFWKQELTIKEDYCRKEEVENVIKKQWMVIVAIRYMNYTQKIMLIFI